jgi:hypothetical protein
MLSFGFMLVGAVVMAWPMQSLSHASCRFGSSAEFAAPPSELHFCLGESNTEALTAQKLAPWLGGASGFRSAGVNFNVAMAPPELFALASPDDGDAVLAIIEARIPVADSIAGAKWFTQMAPLTDSVWSDCASDGLGNWQVCRHRYLPFSTGPRLIETIRFSRAPLLAADTTARFYVTHSKCLTLEGDC